MIKTFLGIIILLFTSVTNLSNELETRSILNDKVEIKIPKDFEVMSEEMMKIKYPSEKRPTLVFSNESGGINVGFNLTQNKADQSQIETYKAVFEKTFKNMYPSAAWKNVGVKKVNDRNIGYLELVTPAIDTKIYNLIFFTDLNGQLLICTFNCTEEDMDKWANTAHEIMNSIKLK